MRLVEGRAQHHVDVSLFNNASAPLTRRDQASTGLLTLALAASRPLTVGSVVITPYGGFNMLMPIGQRERGVFTPVETLRTGIAGMAVSLNKSWSAFFEYNPGPHLQCAGIALAYVRPAPPPRP